jgi:hypothetical protein
MPASPKRGLIGYAQGWEIYFGLLFSEKNMHENSK